MRRWLRAPLEGARALWSDDRVVARIVLVFSLVQLTAIFWDLPASWGWENDGVAPRDLFGGLAYNLTPGSGHRYPLLHYLILALLCLPVLVPAALYALVARAGLMPTVLSVPVMTGVALVAKLVAVAMMGVAILALARLARRTLSRRAARYAALFAATCVSVAYYGRVSNLDGPYLMWTVLALERLYSVAERGAARDYGLAALFVAASVATKDQAYATWIGILPLALWLVPRTQRALGLAVAHSRLAARAGFIGLGAYGLLSGALLNPTGFARRVSELTGGASGDWRQYEGGISGIWANLTDLAANQAQFWWPWPVVALAWLGVAVVSTRSATRDGPGVVAVWRFVPLVAGVSSLVFFTLVVARCEHRFALVLGFVLAYYAGAAAAWLTSLASARGGALARGLLAGLAGWAALHAFAVHLTQWGDARFQVVDWLAAQPAGTLVETYGLVVYLPHFDLSDEAPYHVQRVSDRPLGRRNPLPGGTELEGPYHAVQVRGPDVLVIPEGFANRFLSNELAGGQTTSSVRARAQADDDARSFFEAAVHGRLEGYELVSVFATGWPGWAEALGLAPCVVHGSTGRRVWVLAREGR